jgi:DNA-binding Lrp family transcriptional regulator
VPRKHAFHLDELDRKLLELLQNDAARPLYELGDRVGLSASAVQRRLSRYRSSGVIAKQIAVLDPDAVAGTVLACVLVTLERESKKLHGAFQQRLRVYLNGAMRLDARQRGRPLEHTCALWPDDLGDSRRVRRRQGDAALIYSE